MLTGQGGYNYQSNGGNYNNANNANYNYQVGSNSIDSNYNNLGSRNTYAGIPSPQYGPAFH